MDTEAMAKANPHMDPTGKRTGESEFPTPPACTAEPHHHEVTTPAPYSTPRSSTLWLTVRCCRPERGIGGCGASHSG